MLLRCSACASELAGLGNDVIFVCRNCGRAWVLQDSFVPVRLIFVEADPSDREESGSVYLPFWRITSKLTIERRVSRPSVYSGSMPLDAWRDERGLELTSFPERDETYVFPAFCCARVLSIGVAFRKSPPPLVEDEDMVAGPYPPVVGGTLSQEDAGSLARAVAVGVEIARDDFVAGIDLKLEVRGLELLGVPCSVRKRGFKPPGRGVFIPYGSMQDAEEILAHHSLRVPGQAR